MPQTDAGQAAVESWVQSIRRLDGSLPFRHYRDLRIGTLDLESADGEARRALLAGEPVPVSRLYPHDPLRASAGRSARGIQQHADLVARGMSSSVVHLGMGLATWTDPYAARRPSVPVLLRAARIELPVAGQDPVLTLTSQARVSEVLLEELTQAFGLRIDPTELLDADGDVRYPVVVERLRSAVPSHVVDGFAIEHRAVLFVGSPTAARAARRTAADARLVAGSAILEAALGGQALPEDRPEPLLAETGDEALTTVIDLDGRQRHAVEFVVRSGSLLVQAPPGTGSIQVAAAVAAAVAAQDTDATRVVVVADSLAQQQRLAQRLAGLGLDRLATFLGIGIRADGASPTMGALSSDSDMQAMAAGAEHLEHQLLAARRAVHQAMPPAGITAYEAFAIGRSHPVDVPLLDVEGLRLLESSDPTSRRQDLAEFTQLGGLSISATSTPWFGALPADEQAAADLLETVRTLRESTVPRLRDVSARAAVEVGLPAPDGPAAAAGTADLLARVALAEQRFHQHLWVEPLERLTAATGRRSERRGGGEEAVGLAERRRLRAEAAGLARRPDLAASRPRLHDALRHARDTRQAWASRARDGRLPRTGASAAALAGLMEEYERGQAELMAAHPGVDLAELSFAAVLTRLDSLVDDGPTLTRLPRLTEAAAALADAGLGPLVAALRARAEQGGVPDEAASVEAFDRCRAASTAEYLLDAEPALAAEAGRLDDVRAQYAMADVARTWMAARSLADRLVRDSGPAGTRPVLVGGALELTADEQVPERFELLVVLSAHATPLAHVADLLARARRVICLGDPQLPSPALTPMAMDTGTAERGQEEPGPHLAPGSSVWESLEPVLPSLPLRVPYRPRHHLLVEPWNDILYQARLAVPPGATDDGVLAFEHVRQPPGRKGEEDSVAAEVDAVVEAVLEQVRDRPEESLAVITLGRAHGDAVRRALAAAAGRTVGLAGELAKRPDEPLLVLAAEDVRGEVRDAIIFSVGYGRTLDGRLLYRFGPLNAADGERWLGLALSRARVRLQLVSTLVADELETRRLAAAGLWRLREVLAFAATQGLERPSVPSGHPDPGDPGRDPLLEEVLRRLGEAGLPVAGPVGRGALRVPIAVNHPRRPGRGVLALDTDGSPTEDTRTRERLLPEQWARCGWRHLRVNAADWARAADDEVTRVMAVLAEASAVADALDAARHSPPGAGPAADAMPEAPDGATASPRGSAPEVPTGRPLDSYPPEDVLRVAAWLDTDQSEAELVATLGARLGAGSGAGDERILRIAVRAARSLAHAG